MVLNGFLEWFFKWSWPRHQIDLDWVPESRLVSAVESLRVLGAPLDSAGLSMEARIRPYRSTAEICSEVHSHVTGWDPSCLCFRYLFNDLKTFSAVCRCPDLVFWISFLFYSEMPIAASVFWMHAVTAALEGFRPRFRRGSRGAAGGGKKSGGGKKGGGKKLNPFFRRW